MNKFLKVVGARACRFWRLTLLALALALSGCENMQSMMGKPATDEAGAQALMANGEFRDAAVAYKRLSKADRNQRARLQLASANAWREEGDFKAVQRELKTIKRASLAQQEAVQFDLLDAEILLSQGDAQGALNLLVADPKKLSPTLAASYFELRAQAFEALGDFADAAAERAALDPLLDSVARAANAHEIKTLLARLKPDEILNLVRVTPRLSPLHPYLTGFGAAPRDGSANSFADSMAAPAASKTAQLDESNREPVRKIALLLPTTGPAAGAGKAVQDGIFSAYFSDTSPQRPELVLIDSGSTAASGKAAYDQAIAEGCDHVIGPLQRDQVTAIFQSKALMVPTLALNFAETPTLPPKGSLQFALLPEEEAVSAAEHMADRGLKRVAVLVPNDDFGKRAAEAFEARFSALGGSVGERAFFASIGGDSSGAIRTALGVTESQARATLVRGIVGIPFTTQAARRYDLEGLFLGARPPQARLLMPQLRAFDAEDWPIVATSHAYSGQPNATLDRDLNGLEFCDAPWLLAQADVPGIPTRASLSTLSSTVGAGGRLVAFGIDAYRALPYLGWLERNPGLAIVGATGLLSADQNGSVRRKPSWAVMRSGLPTATQ